MSCQLCDVWRDVSDWGCRVVGPKFTKWWKVRWRTVIIKRCFWCNCLNPFTFILVQWNSATDKKLSFVHQISQPIKLSKKWFSTQNEPYYVMFQMRQTPNLADNLITEKACKSDVCTIFKTLYNVMPRFLLNFFTSNTFTRLENHTMCFEYWTVSEKYFTNLRSKIELFVSLWVSMFPPLPSNFILWWVICHRKLLFIKYSLRYFLKLITKCLGISKNLCPITNTLYLWALPLGAVNKLHNHFSAHFSPPTTKHKSAKEV